MKKYELKPTDDNIKATLKEDLLDRNRLLNNFAKMINNIDDNVVISVDGKWGSGKTFFIKQLLYIIKNHNDINKGNILFGGIKDYIEINEKYLCMYYNSWENDYHNDPIESMMHHILNSFPQQKEISPEIKENINKYLHIIFKNLINIMSNGVMNEKVFESYKTYDYFIKDISSIEEKKKAFQSLINDILSINDKKRLLIVVDEIDRCNPSYAVRLLEVIKHYFSSENITIVLSTNTQELSKTIKKHYGNDFDGYGYLDKFIDFIVNLEVMDLRKYLDKRMNFKTDRNCMCAFSFLAMKYYDFSLRDCNRFFIFYNILNNIYDFEEKGFNYVDSTIIYFVVPFALASKIKNIDNYNMLINDNGAELLLDFINKEFKTDKVMEDWLKEMIGENYKLNNSGKTYEELVVERYHNIFNDKNRSIKFPFLESMTMLMNDFKF